MYEKYWGLKSLPFENAPDSRFFYPSMVHAEALSRLNYAVTCKKGAAMLTGEIGCGKTLLTRILIQDLARDGYEMAIIVNPTMNPLDLLKETIYQFGLESSSSSKTELLHVLNTGLLKNIDNRKGNVLIVDEAQSIKDSETFEELRLLLNFQLNDSFALTLILVGQTELRDILASIPQLDQRIAIKCHLQSFDRSETFNYIGYRLQRAGRKDILFNHEALDSIYQYSQGIPRKINNLCDLALLSGFGSRVKMIDKSIISNVIDDSR